MLGKNNEKVYINTTALKSSLVDPTGKLPESDLFERVFAATLMSYAVGDDAVYDHQTGCSTGMMGGAMINGLIGCTPSQYCRIATLLKGKEQTVVKDDAAREVLNKGQQLPLIVDIRWNESGRDANHAILATKIENGRVYYENPQGSASLDKDGPPSRRSEGGKGFESMPVAEFMARVNRVVVPVSDKAPALTANSDDVLQGIIAQGGGTVQMDPAVFLITEGKKNDIRELTPKELSQFLDEHGEHVAERVEAELNRREGKKKGLPQVMANEEEEFRLIRMQLKALNLLKQLQPRS
jgi:hypothetical protein